MGGPSHRIKNWFNFLDMDRSAIAAVSYKAAGTRQLPDCEMEQGGAVCDHQAVVRRYSDSIPAMSGAIALMRLLPARSDAHVLCGSSGSRLRVGISRLHLQSQAAQIV